MKDELSPAARTLFDRAQKLARPTPAERAELLAKIERKIAAPPPPSTPALPWIGGGVVLTILAIGAFLAWPREAAPPPPPVPVVISHGALAPDPVPVVEPVVAPTPVAEPVLEPAALLAEPVLEPAAPLARRRAQHRAAVITPPAPIEEPGDDTLAQELVLLRRAQHAQSQRRYDEAGQLLAEHAARFEHGVLRAERDVATAALACARGDLARGRALAAPLLASAWGPRLREACHIDPSEQP